MTRIRLFLAAVVASFGVLSVVHVAPASAVVVHLEAGEEEFDPGSPPPPPPEGELLSVCLTVRALTLKQCLAV